MNMKNLIVIKSYQNGISIYLNEEVSFHELVEQITEKFQGGRKFFRNAKLAVSFEGRNLTLEEEQELVDVISKNSDLEIVCIKGKETDSMNECFRTALSEYERENQNKGYFYRGNLENGQVLERDTSIIVVGDVNPGCKVISTKDIIILGALNGEAHAGTSGNEGHYVVALEMESKKLKIGNYTYEVRTKKSMWRRKQKMEPKIAYIKENNIYMEVITKELLNKISV